VRQRPGLAHHGRAGGYGQQICAERFELPVEFDLAESWLPKAVIMDTDPDSELAFLTRQGPVAITCEIDAKPAGNIGFLRVWIADASDDSPRQILDAFMAEAGDIEEPEYLEAKAGEFAAAEVSYLTSSELFDESKKERALAVSTPNGVVVLHLGGLDTEEHEAMLPAYELAKQSMRSA
jgi:hypothetical protein